MDERQFEEMLSRVLQHDLSSNSETFRDELLARCLEIIEAEDSGCDLNDEQMDLLAAAGELLIPLPHKYPHNSQ